MKILLTGDRGYIGTVLKPMLRNHGHTVMGLDTNYFKDCTIYRLLDEEMEEPHIDMDIRDLQNLDLTGYDAVVHLAALSNDVLGDLDKRMTEAVNYHSTMMLATIAKECGVGRFVFASSCSVYGASDRMVSEESRLNPQTDYAIYKAYAEDGLSRLADGDFHPTMLRNATVYGLSVRLRNDLVVNTMTAHAYQHGKIKVFGDGTLYRPLVHVKDVCQAILLVLEAPIEKVHNQTFNVGFTGQNYTIKQVAEIIAGNLRGTTVEYCPTDDRRNYRVNCSKFKEFFPEFELTRDVDSEVRRIIDFYKDIEAIIERRFDDEYLLGSRFIRLKYLEKLKWGKRIDEALRWL